MKPLYIRIGLLVTFILFVTSVSVSILLNNRQESKTAKLPSLGQVKSFQMTDEDGNTFTGESLHGKVWIANFFFTTCADICPMMTKHMSTLYRSFELEPGVKLVSFTVNPEYDTPAILKNYASKLKIKSDKWFFLTSTREKIQDLAVNTFKLGSMDEPVFHSAYFSLVDRSGYIRGYYDGTKKEEINRLYKDVARLLKERW